MRMSSIMRWRSGLAFACGEVMIGLLLENEAGCLIRQHTEPRGGPPTNRTRWPEPSTARAVSFIVENGTVRTSAMADDLPTNLTGRAAVAPWKRALRWRESERGGRGGRCRWVSGRAC